MLECICAVSYTHLDVYKRQGHTIIISLLFIKNTVNIKRNTGINQRTATTIQKLSTILSTIPKKLNNVVTMNSKMCIRDSLWPVYLNQWIFQHLLQSNQFLQHIRLYLFV